MELIPGVTDLVTLLDVLKDNKKAAEHVKRLQDLSDEIALQLEIKGTIEEIKDLRSKAERELAEAKRTELVARDEAEKQRAQLRREKAEATDRARQLEEKALGNLKEFERNRTLTEDVLKSQEMDVKRREVDVLEREQRARDREQAAETVARQYNEKVAKLKACLATI